MSIAMLEQIVDECAEALAHETLRSIHAQHPSLGYRDVAIVGTYVLLEAMIITIVRSTTSVENARKALNEIVIRSAQAIPDDHIRKMQEEK